MTERRLVGQQGYEVRADAGDHRGLHGLRRANRRRLHRDFDRVYASNSRASSRRFHIMRFASRP
jgi:hypothetical protein